MEKKISVIIPCFNVEKYILRCAKSLITQTIGIENLELIFINDASTDTTGDLLQQLETLYPDDIIIICLAENLRQGGARNIGLQYASCDYIAFVDADDWVEPRMYELLYNKMLEFDVELVSCNFKRVKKEDEPMGMTEMDDRLVVIDSEEKRRELLIKNCGYGGIWSKLYKRKFIEEHRISFPEHLAYEDNYWSALIDLYVKKYYVVEEYLYHYFINTESTMLSQNKAYQFDRLKVELIKLEELKTRGVLELYYEEFEYNFLNLFYLNTLYIIFDRFSYIPLDIIRLMQKLVKEQFPNYNHNKYMDLPENKIRKAFLRTVDMDIDEYGWAEIKNSLIESNGKVVPKSTVELLGFTGISEG